MAVISPQLAESRLAEAHRSFQHRIEDRCGIAGRGVDDLQYLGRRGLLLQCLVTLGFALGKLTFQIGYEPRGIG